MNQVNQMNQMNQMNQVHQVNNGLSLSLPLAPQLLSPNYFLSTTTSPPRSPLGSESDSGKQISLPQNQLSCDQSQFPLMMNTSPNIVIPPNATSAVANLLHQYQLHQLQFQKQLELLLSPSISQTSKNENEGNKKRQHIKQEEEEEENGEIDLLSESPGKVARIQQDEQPITMTLRATGVETLCPIDIHNEKMEKETPIFSSSSIPQTPPTILIDYGMKENNDLFSSFGKDDFLSTSTSGGQQQQQAETTLKPESLLFSSADSMEFIV